MIVEEGEEEGNKVGNPLDSKIGAMAHEAAMLGEGRGRGMIEGHQEMEEEEGEDTADEGVSMIGIGIGIGEDMVGLPEVTEVIETDKENEEKAGNHVVVTTDHHHQDDPGRGAEVGVHHEGRHNVDDHLPHLPEPLFLDVTNPHFAEESPPTMMIRLLVRHLELVVVTPHLQHHLAELHLSRNIPKEGDERKIRPHLPDGVYHLLPLVDEPPPPPKTIHLQGEPDHRQ